MALCLQTVGAEEPTTLGFVHPELKEWAEEQASFENYEAMRARQAAWKHDESDYQWERRVDLNGDGRPEVLLLYNQPAYYGRYSGFTQRGEKWVFIGRFSIGARNPVLLKKRRQGWRDFTVDLDASRGRINRDIYKWDEKEGMYTAAPLKTVRPAFEVDHEP
ncbi:hypothetical protein ACXR0O_25190 [Verrucomicrobiota bacterium sgz303538]